MKQPLRLDMDGVPETELVGRPQVWDELRHEIHDSAGRVLETESRSSMQERATRESVDPKELPEDYLHRQDLHIAQAYRDQKPAACIHAPLRQENASDQTNAWTFSTDLIVFRRIEPKIFLRGWLDGWLGFAIPYLYNGQMHDYVPDFLIRLKSSTQVHIIFETKGYDQLEQLKRAAAERWVAAVNAEGSYGRWHYLVAKNIESIPQLITDVAKVDPRS